MFGVTLSDSVDIAVIQETVTDVSGGSLMKSYHTCAICGVTMA